MPLLEIAFLFEHLLIYSGHVDILSADVHQYCFDTGCKKSMISTSLAALLFCVEFDLYEIT